ncbi:unnamed protein product [Soboliphyme baturini]|uniref:RRM domain-containing protein n=1 Tax=Soboliphyme baturini TaxID=241478 RepID=A0A183IRI4_9BILA|nr:unnamed protein product [Soboliphyme baturini]
MASPFAFVTFADASIAQQLVEGNAKCIMNGRVLVIAYAIEKVNNFSSPSDGQLEQHVPDNNLNTTCIPPATQPTILENNVIGQNLHDCVNEDKPATDSSILSPPNMAASLHAGEHESPPQQQQLPLPEMNTQFAPIFPLPCNQQQQKIQAPLDLLIQCTVESQEAMRQAFYLYATQMQTHCNELISSYLTAFTEALQLEQENQSVGFPMAANRNTSATTVNMTNGNIASFLPEVNQVTPMPLKMPVNNEAQPPAANESAYPPENYVQPTCGNFRASNATFSPKSTPTRK